MTANVSREDLLASVHQLQPGDILVVKSADGHPPMDERTAWHLDTVLAERLRGLDVRWLIITGDLDLAAYRPVGPQ